MATAFLPFEADHPRWNAFAGGEALDRRAYRLGWIVLFCGAICAIVILRITGMTLGFSGMELLLGTLALLCAAHCWYRVRGGNSRLETATGTLAMMIASALLAGIISNAGLRLRRPLIDGLLLGVDSRLGIDTPALVSGFSEYARAIDILDIAYVSSLQLCIAAAIGLAVSGSTSRAWEVACTFAVSILTFSLVAACFPAMGLFPYSGVHLLLGNRLPEGAGIYHMNAFHALYEGHDRMLRLRELTGVVTFPSFHLVTGAIIARAGRGTRFLGFVAGIWGVLIAISALPIGGHYVVDLIAGLVFWLALVCWMGRNRVGKSAAS